MTRIGNTLTALGVAATIAIATVAAPQPAQARHGRIAAGVIGGLAAGAVLGSIAANNGYYGYGYSPYPAYYGPHCWWHRERVWDGYGWQLRRVRVCD